MKTFSILWSVFAVACGGNDGGNSLPLNPAFAKLWTGTTVVSTTPDAPPPLMSWGFDSQVEVNLYGRDLYARISPPGVDWVTASGSGNVASWDGHYSCQPTYANTDCSLMFVLSNGGCSLTFALTHGVLTLSSDTKTLDIAARGTVSGCHDSDITLAFLGE